MKKTKDLVLKLIQDKFDTALENKELIKKIASRAIDHKVFGALYDDIENALDDTGYSYGDVSEFLDEYDLSDDDRDDIMQQLEDDDYFTSILDEVFPYAVAFNTATELDDKTESLKKANHKIAMEKRAYELLVSRLRLQEKQGDTLYNALYEVIYDHVEMVVKEGAIDEVIKSNNTLELRKIVKDVIIGHFFVGVQEADKIANKYAFQLIDNTDIFSKQREILEA